ncbi:MULTISPECIES: hypothetical protein [Serratia]|uniref:hypothetical protein n=1 Tax=Serratia TaxID=613 RepID=UPI00066019B9|nr:hypothetical protein [Serratia sp. 506_PEND]
MKERPVIFNGEMVRAILHGRKTQTRRTIANVGSDNCIPLQKPTKTKDGIYTHVMDAPAHGLCPFGRAGDRLWVRETFGDCGNRLVYRADTEDGAASQVKRWVPSIHMPREACRTLLEITAVRVERLNDISHEDAKAEGCCYGRGGGVPDFAVTPADHFPTLWASIYGVENWRANPWVWVIEFKQVSAREVDRG